jgi:hypothetical protein
MTDYQIELVNSELIRGGDQIHPYHIYSVKEHTDKVVDAAKKADPTLEKVAFLHDVGKASVKGFNAEKCQDTFYSHAKASVEFCDANGIDLTDMERDLILEHDNCKSWVNGKKLGKLIRKHGVIFASKLITLVKCDMAGQSDIAKNNNNAIERIAEWAK